MIQKRPKKVHSRQATQNISRYSDAYLKITLLRSNQNYFPCYTPKIVLEITCSYFLSGMIIQFL